MPQPQPPIAVQPFPMRLPEKWALLPKCLQLGFPQRSEMARLQGSGIDFLPPLF